MAAEAPSAAGTPLLGSMLDLLRDPLEANLRARREHGDVVRFSAGPPGLRTDFYGLYSPEGAQTVLATESANFRKDNIFYEEVRQLVGNGLLTSQDTDYQRQRRLVQPLFTRRRVDGYATAITAEAASLATAWHTATTVELAAEMNRFALRVAGRVLFGTDVEVATAVVRRSLPVLNGHAVKRGLSPLKPPRHWPTPGNRRAARAQTELYALCDSIVGKRRAAPAADDGAAEDLVTLLTRAENAEDGSLDAGELREHMLVFLLAGHETTAIALAFALHLLARHPKEQQRVREELDRVLGGRTPDAGDMEALPYLMMVLKETLRLYPPAPMVSRRAVTETEIGGYRIPAGADVFVSPWVTHRHPDHWPDPELFDPERFTPEAEAAGRPRYAWFPFGGGPRACIGQHLSMLESVLSLAVLLQHYEFEAVDHDIPLGTGLTLVPQGPMRCRVTRRTTAPPTA